MFKPVHWIPDNRYAGERKTPKDAIPPPIAEGKRIAARKLLGEKEQDF